MSSHRPARPLGPCDAARDADRRTRASRRCCTSEPRPHPDWTYASIPSDPQRAVIREGLRLPDQRRLHHVRHSEDRLRPGVRQPARRRQARRPHRRQQEPAVLLLGRDERRGRHRDLGELPDVSREQHRRQARRRARQHAMPTSRPISRSTSTAAGTSSPIRRSAPSCSGSTIASRRSVRTRRR